MCTIVAKIPELSTTRTSETRGLGQNLGMLPEYIFSMKLNERQLLQVTQLATQVWDPGIPRFACTDWFSCYVILLCRGLLHALLRRTSQLLTQTSEKCYAFLAYYSLITTTTASLYMEVTACRMQHLAAQRGKNQSALLSPFCCDILLGHYWEQMLDRKQSWNQDGFIIFGVESTCCLLLVGKVPPWRGSAFSPGKDDQNTYVSYGLVVIHALLLSLQRLQGLDRLTVPEPQGLCWTAIRHIVGSGLGCTRTMGSWRSKKILNMSYGGCYKKNLHKNELRGIKMYGFRLK